MKAQVIAIVTIFVSLAIFQNCAPVSLTAVPPEEVASTGENSPSGDSEPTNTEIGELFPELFPNMGAGQIGTGLPVVVAPPELELPEVDPELESDPTLLMGTIATGATFSGEEGSLAPLTTKAGVTTILMALGDSVNNKLVGNPVSNQFLVESVIRYTTPVANPKILVVRARDHQSESTEDTTYIFNLLSRYQATLIDEPVDGLLPEHLVGYDAVWFNNPGYPFSKQVTVQTLIAFSGGVVVQGDDLSRGANFSVSELTGLQYIDNGTSVVCGGKTYPHDNNSGEQYRVTLDAQYISGLDQSTITFRYGNDIDNTVVIDPTVEVLATAVGGPADCTASRPAVVRRLKQLM